MVSDGHFITKHVVTQASLDAVAGFNAWVENLETHEKERIIKALIEVIDATHATSTSDLMSETIRNIPGVVRVITHTDAQTKRFLYEKFRELSRLMRHPDKKHNP